MKLIDTDTGFKNTEIKISTYDIPQPKNEFSMKLHFKIGVIGASGTGKTSLALSLILSELPRHKKIYFIIGGYNLILESLKKDF
jgi:GTPase SAR1 family protein